MGGELMGGDPLGGEAEADTTRDFVFEAVDLGRTYRLPSGDVVALRGFSHLFEPGLITAIMGPSGSGKTTLLNLLAGLDTPSTGEVLLNGRSISGLDERERAELRRSGFGVVFQSFNLISVLSAEQNVALPMALAGIGRRERSRRAAQLLARFGLSSRADALPYRLSGGERQRVALARALANDPKVLFADEPTGNLDSKSGATVMAALREVAEEGRAVILVTHDATLAEESDLVLQLRDGRLHERWRPRGYTATRSLRVDGARERGDTGGTNHE